MMVFWARRVVVNILKVRPFEDANLPGMGDRLAMESEGKRTVKDDAVVLIYPLMDAGGIPWGRKE